MIELHYEQLFIYGTGSFASDIFNVLSRHNIQVHGFLDHAPRFPVLHGLSVKACESVPPDFRNNIAVIIGIHNRAAHIAEIISRLDALGYAQIITPFDLYDHFADDLGQRYWLAKRTYYADFGPQIQAASRLLKDKDSRDLFDAILRFRTSGDYRLLPAPDLHHQYFPVDLPAWKTPIRLIDCGAFDGDTLRTLSFLGIPIEALAAYEPDQDNFRKLTQTVRQNQITNAVLWPCGVYSTTIQLHFIAGRGEAASLSSNGNVVIQCVSLDDSAPSFAPTLIKMDIEGAELEALSGAERIIAAYQPGLAVCVYHTPGHLWEIPLTIQQYAQKYGIRYNYYLRTYGYNTFETVIYAIP
jgi:FkbM family methyltransferase